MLIDLGALSQVDLGETSGERWNDASRSVSKVAGVYDRGDITMDQLIERLYHVARTGRLE
jgi:hypothetical protein